MNGSMSTKSSGNKSLTEQAVIFLVVDAECTFIFLCKEPPNKNRNLGGKKALGELTPLISATVFENC